MSFYRSLEQLVVESAATVRPPERLTVSQAAEKYRKLNNPGSYVGPWRNRTTPYLVEPMDALGDRRYQGVVFCGPAQCGKTEMVLNWLNSTAICDPADMTLFCPTQNDARDFSMRRIDRLHRHSPEIGSKLITKRNADNTFDKKYTNGMIFTLSWPSISQMSGRPLPRTALTDYDRMAQDVDGEGNPFDLARKRTTTFRSYGKTLAESTPGFVVETANWIAKGAHQAPPTEGILALYNRGDRRRWNWKCVSCKHAFEPDFSLLKWPDSDDFMESAEGAYLGCPHCGQVYTHDGYDDIPGKVKLNESGFWLAEGQTMTPEGKIVGKPRRSDIASFWLKGVAAEFTNWKGLVLKYLEADREYRETGSENALKVTVNTDQGLPYTMKSSENERLPEHLKDRAVDLGQKVVPLGTRFLISTIDVQKHKFVVQVHGIGMGGDVWIVDRFDIIKSQRYDDDGERKYVTPGAYLEDWKRLIPEVLLKEYPLCDGSGRHMACKLTVCDSGGRAGVTANAYNFYRYLKSGPGEEKDPDDDFWIPGLANRFLLIKGSSHKSAPRVQISYPDSQRKDRHAGARGEIPVLFINTDQVKDQVNMMLDREEPHGGMINFPKWLPDNFYKELCVEVKTDKGWENPKKFRNESWDLLTYLVAATLTRYIRLDKINWDDPPIWAAHWDENPLVFAPGLDEKPFENEVKRATSLADLGKTLG